MAGLLGDNWDIDPSDVSVMAANQGSPSWTPSETPVDPDTMATAQPQAPAADSKGGFLSNLADIGGNIGAVLGGGLDPSITGPARTLAGTRALLNFGLTTLMNSGPSYTPRNLGQILASGLSAAADSNLLTEQNRVKAQQAAATLALKSGQLKIQELLAGITGAKAAQELGSKAAVKAAAAADLAAPGGGAGGAPAAGPATPGAAPDGAYGQGGPDTTPVPPEYLPYYEEASKRTGIPVDVLIAQTRQESSFNPTNRGKAGEIGLGQVMPSTALAPGAGVASVDPEKLTDPRTAINFQADYLRSKIPGGMSPSDPVAIRHALVGYNGGGDKDYVAHVTRYLPPPAATPPPTQVAGPGAPPAPSGGPTLPAPPGAAPSPAPAVLGPGAPVPVTVQPVTPSAPDFSDIAARRAEVEQTYRTDLANVANSGDPNARATADDKRQASIAALNKEVADRKADFLKHSDTLKQQGQIEQAKLDAESQRVAAQQKAETDRNAATIAAENQRNEADRLNQQELERIKANISHHQVIQQQAASDAQNNVLKPTAELAFKAHQMNLGLAQLQPILADLPQGGTPMAAFIQAHPDAAPMLNAAGVLSDKQMDATRLVNGLVSNISTQMKPTGLGALREYEWDAFKAQLPSLMTTPDGQQKAVGLLMNLNNRVLQEKGWVDRYFNRQVPDDTPGATPGATTKAHNLDPPDSVGADGKPETLDERMTRELGPIVPTYTGPLTGPAQAAWEASLPPGKPYYKTWAVPDPKSPTQPQRDKGGNVVTTKSLEFRPW